MRRRLPRTRSGSAALCIPLALAFVAGASLASGPMKALQSEGFAVPVRVLVFYDMEGASGIDSGSMFDVRQPAAYELGRRQLSTDVNAVVEGLFDAGATAVDVFNTHGSGGDTLVPRRMLDARAKIISRRGPRLAYDPANGLRDSGYVAMVSVAAHDKPRSGGFSPHTVGIGTSPVINGVALTETDLLAYALGVGGVPMILASGDDVLGRSLKRTLPWIEYVVVKRTTASRVELMPPDQVQAELRAAASRALRAVRESRRMRPLRLRSPIRAGVLPTFPAWLSPSITDLPGLARQGDTVVFQASDYPEAFRGMRILMDLASASADGYMLDLLTRSPEGRRLVREARDTVSAQSAAFERGEWRPPSQYR